MTVNEATRHRWLQRFLELRTQMRPADAGHAVGREIRAELRAAGMEDSCVAHELRLHRLNVRRAYKQQEHVKQMQRAANKSWRLNNISSVRAAQRAYLVRRRAMVGRPDRAQEHLKTALKRAQARGLMVASMEDLLHLRAERQAEHARKKRLAAEKAAASAERLAAQRDPERVRVATEASRRRWREYDNSWPRRAKRKLGRNAHRMPELVELYRLTCELKRATR